MKIVKESLFEDVIDRDVIEINIDFGVDRSNHAIERQNRDSEHYIENEEISNNVKGAFAQITNKLIFDELNIGQRIIIQNIDSKLNIVGVPLKSEDGVIMFKLITVMRSSNFRNIHNTKIIQISDNDMIDY